MDVNSVKGKVMAADLVLKIGKAKVRRALRESVLSHRRRRSRHVRRSYFINLRDPCGGPQEVGNTKAKAGAIVTGKSDYIVIALIRVMTGEQRV